MTKVRWQVIALFLGLYGGECSIGLLTYHTSKVVHVLGAGAVIILAIATVLCHTVMLLEFYASPPSETFGEFLVHSREHLRVMGMMCIGRGEDMLDKNEEDPR